jgi:predicted Zn-dependent protease
MNNIEAYIRDVDRLCEAESYVESEGLLLNLLYDEPDYAQLHSYLGWLYLYHLNNLDKAHLHLDYAIRFDAGYYPAYCHMAEVLLKRQDYATLEEYMLKALEANEASLPQVYDYLGQAREKGQAYKEAIRYYSKGLINCYGDWETQRLNNNIKRCRKKRWLSLWR